MTESVRLGTAGAVETRARLARCVDVCWAGPGEPCGDSRGGLAGVHLARVTAAYRQGFITRAELRRELEPVIVSGEPFWDYTEVMINREQSPEGTE